MSNIKPGEKRTRKKQAYDSYESEIDKKAKERFKQPASLQGKLTAIAAIKIIERNVDRLNDERKHQLEDIARECLEKRM